MDPHTKSEINNLNNRIRELNEQHRKIVTNSGNFSDQVAGIWPLKWGDNSFSTNAFGVQISGRRRVVRHNNNFYNEYIFRAPSEKDISDFAGPEVGRFYTDTSGNVFFTLDDRQNYICDSNHPGLDTQILKVIHSRLLESSYFNPAVGNGGQ